jgi:hypothetical protein
MAMASPKGHVAGGLAAAQVVVVQGGQVVVDERVGVEHLEGRAQPLNARLGSAPAMVTAACMASTGRSRLPPAKSSGAWRHESTQERSPRWESALPARGRSAPRLLNQRFHIDRALFHDK